MIRRPPRSTLFPYTTALPICRQARDELASHQEQPEERRDRPGRELQHGERDRQRVGLGRPPDATDGRGRREDRKSTRLNSSHANISYAVFCLKKKKTQQ